MSGAGQFWMSFRQKRQCGCLGERETENKGKERIKHGNTKHSGREERTVWTLQLPTGLHCAAQEPHWSDEAIKYEHTSSEWSDWSQPKVEPNNFSCLDEASRVFGWQLDEPACLSGQRTNCDTRCERRRQRSGEREAGRQGVKDWMRKKRVWEKEWGQMLSQWLTPVVTKSQIAQKNKGISVQQSQTWTGYFRYVYEQRAWLQQDMEQLSELVQQDWAIY